MFDPEAFGASMGDLICEAVAPLLKRVEQMEARQLQRGEKGEPGIPGRDGERGPQGERGEAGQQGKDGANGADGMPGKDGVAGINGERGEDGVPGKDGRDGVDGRDALEIDILPDVVAGKSYRHKTFARWRGGLIRAARNTTPLMPGDDVRDHGWEVVINGAIEKDANMFDCPNFSSAFKAALND